MIFNPIEISTKYKRLFLLLKIKENCKYIYSLKGILRNPDQGIF